MIRARRSVGMLLALFLAGIGAPAVAAKKDAPEIKAYQKQMKEKKKAAEKDKREAERQDPQRLLRPYQTYDEINADLDGLIAAHPDFISGGTFGRTPGGRELRWVRVNAGEGDQAEVLVTANIHAQELAGGQMAMALLHYLADNYATSLDVKRMLSQTDIYFIPVMNPDGMARASEQQARHGITWFIRKNEGKVDLNRNYPYPAAAPDQLKDSAGSPKPRSETYRGTQPLSEPESRAVDAFVSQHRFVLALGYHTSGGLILYGPGTFPDPLPDTGLMREIGLAYQAKQFDRYQVQPSIDLYPTLGALDDYLYHRYGILALTVEVGAHTQDTLLDPHHGRLSPIFWAYNVAALEQEKANNVPGALTMIEAAIRVHQQPELRKWQPPTEKWVGEP
jgi:predicted deacylase